MSREIILLIRPDDLGVPLIKQGKGTTSGADIDRLPEPIKNQNLTVE